MALPVFADRVKETTTTTGTGTLTLAGAASQFQSFAVVGNGLTCYYAIVGQTGTEWEVGLGTYTASGTTLARTTVLASSNSNAAVSLSAGTKDVFLDIAAATVGGLNALANGGIIGLNPQWTSTTVLGCSAGACFIESLGYAVYGAPADITPSSPANSTWYHIYAYSNSGVLTLESSTTAPVAFTNAVGTARSKSGDTSRRYLYSARTSAAGAFLQFAYDPSCNLWLWQNTASNAAPFRCLSAGAATTSTAVDCSAVVPTTSRLALLSLAQGSITVAIYVGSNDLTISATIYDLSCPTNPSGNLFRIIGLSRCSSTQNVSYLNSAGSGASYIDVLGFHLQR